MNLLTINFFTLFFGIIILTINGCRLGSNGFFGKKQSLLVINLGVDPFFKMSALCVQASVYQNLLRMNKQRMGMNPKLNAKLLMEMTAFANNNIGPRIIMQLCTQCGTPCGMQTKLKFIGDPILGQGSLRRRGSLTMSQRRQNVFDNAIHEGTYGSIRRGSMGSMRRGSIGSGGGSFRNRPGSFRNGGPIQHSASVRARQRAALANARPDSDEY
ncbi:Hypothetical protein SRAE_X000051100 [Strongyloides ratti]|uniref:Uncharacterized protein n=1 Tax=Strongyloides ratti TaxID=34506 RepID=A0A090LUA4_STRRB|nr:Hypothetical protein SRAE_X000051100 [Strongyloides ratti]CEF71184.1 Hypothetical protein SRAE_X000051100 [Strongyloides ratti]